MTGVEVQERRRSGRLAGWLAGWLAGGAAGLVLLAVPGLGAAGASGLSARQDPARPDSAGQAQPQADAEGRARPQRIVSLNVCTDQLLMQLVEHRRIAAVTHLARDPRYSAMAAEARALPVTRGQAEQVIALDPDLVLAGSFSARETVALLRRLGYQVVELTPESDLAGIPAAIRRLGSAVGEPERAETLVRSFEAELTALPQPTGGRPVYADYQANGFTSGEGTLLADIANRAGFDTLGQRLGLAGIRQVPLEQLLALRPDLIDLPDRGTAPALATDHVRHPAWRHLLADGKRISIPANLTTCGTLRTLEAARMLAAARAQWR